MSVNDSCYLSFAWAGPTIWMKEKKASEKRKPFYKIGSLDICFAGAARDVSVRIFSRESDNDAFNLQFTYLTGDHLSAEKYDSRNLNFEDFKWQGDPLAVTADQIRQLTIKLRFFWKSESAESLQLSSGDIPLKEPAQFENGETYCLLVKSQSESLSFSAEIVNEKDIGRLVVARAMQRYSTQLASSSWMSTGKSWPEFLRDFEKFSKEDQRIEMAYRKADEEGDEIRVQLLEALLKSDSIMQMYEKELGRFGMNAWIPTADRLSLREKMKLVIK